MIKGTVHKDTGVHSAEGIRRCPQGVFLISPRLFYPFPQWISQLKILRPIILRDLLPSSHKCARIYCIQHPLPSQRTLPSRGSASHVDRRSIDSELYGVRTGMEVYTSALATQTIVFLCRERRTSTYTSTKGLETGRQRHRKVKSVVYSTYIHMNPMKESKVSRAVKNIIRQMVGIAVIEC